MRPLFLISLCCVVWLPAAANGQTTFPYKASAVTDDVYVRSGPGQNYYATDKLKRGQQVEVYRHDPGGWCAIRPTDGSFTWVSGRFLKPTKHHLAVVTEEGVAARVGSRFGDVRDVIQVRLHRGEVVEVLESPHDDGHSSPWYRIAPPAGEFRWVAAKYLDTEYPHDGLRHRHADRRDAEPADERFVDDPSRRPSYEPSETSGQSLLARSATPRGTSAKEFQDELERIELELSVMLIEEPTTWSFDSLWNRTNTLLDESQTAVERGRARQLANKIAKFEDIKRRQEEVLAMRDRTDRDGRLYARLRPRDDDRDPSAERLEIDARYDGVGQLARVPEPTTGAPRYVLVDRRGDVRCYVTPAPGVRLDNYVGQDVGITGSRSGYLIDQHANHIIARHITPLDGTMLR
ncbi:MAG: SH3 domain-containing protein [Thermoguttaceae bacterium]